MCQACFLALQGSSGKSCLWLLAWGVKGDIKNVDDTVIR